MILSKRRKRIIGLLTIIVLAVIAGWLIRRNLGITSTFQIIHINNTAVKVTLAETPAQIYRGLSGQRSLGEDCGMLFVFPDSGERRFVMRNMEFPLDIIFINQGRIIKIAANLPPEGKSPANIYSSGQPADSVLEVNGGFAASRGFKVGDQVRLID
jgi:hypothetical protein